MVGKGPVVEIEVPFAFDIREGPGPDAEIISRELISPWLEYHCSFRNAVGLTGMPASFKK